MPPSNSDKKVPFFAEKGPFCQSKITNHRLEAMMLMSIGELRNENGY